MPTLSEAVISYEAKLNTVVNTFLATNTAADDDRIGAETAAAQSLTRSAAAAMSQFDALVSKNVATDKATAAAASEVVASAKAAASSASAFESTGQAATATTKAAQTAADRVQTGLDRAATAADRTQTTLDRSATNSDRALVASNLAATNVVATTVNTDATQALASRNQAASSAAASAASATASSTSAASANAAQTATTTKAGEAAADRAQTGLDRVATAADRVQTSLDRAQTAFDRVQTGADRTQTGADRTATTANAASTAADRTATSTSAGQAAGSSSSALAIFGTTAAMNAALATAASQSSAAQTAAASASSVLQQDLSAISAALHRSPNAVTAMTIYDTSKDSDGGAWVDRMQDKSWANEPLNGAWLTGGFATELLARGDNLLSAAEGNAASLALAVGVGDAATTITGYAAALNVQRGASTAAAYRSFATVSGVVYAFTSVIQMDDGSAPVVGTNTDAAADLSTVVQSDVGINASTVTFLGAGAYRITTVFRATTTGVNYGVAKYAGHTVKGFRVTAMKLNQVGVLPSTYSASPELVNNGGFDTDVSGYTAGGTITWSAGTAVCTSGGASATLFARLVTGLTVGKPYRLSTDKLTASRFWLYVGTTSGNNNVRDSGELATAAGVMETVFVATATSHFISGSGAGVNSAATFDNISVKEVTVLATPYVPYSTQTNSYYQSSADGKFYRLGATFAALTEVFRGNKAKFPRLAAIVAEGGSVTFYDLTEPGRPMWMRFSIKSFAAGGSVLLGYNGTITSMAMLNGQLWLGKVLGSPHVNSLIAVNFALDDALTLTTATNNVASNAGYLGRWSGGIARRNTAGGYTALAPYSIVNHDVNAVAITVLPDAPIDVVTGLPVPTIAVMTAGGVSVIRQDGTVASHAFTASTIDAVAFSYLRLLYGNSASVFGVRSIRVADITGSSFVGVAMNSLATSIASNNLAPSRTEGLVAVRQNSGLGRLIQFRLNYVSLSLSLRADTASTHNTGWMIGDVRRAYMADTLVESITATEQISNGTFDTDTSGWVGTSSTLSVVAGKLRITNTSGSLTGFAEQFVTTVIGKSYVFNGQLFAGTSSAYFDLRSPAVVGLVNGVFVAGATSTRVLLRLSSITIGEYADFDNISVKEVSPDRSYKAAAANINGTIVKSAVASAAQLVTYSGWSALNYLQEPYSADLDYGVGDFRLSAWVNYLPTRVNLLLDTEGVVASYGNSNVVLASPSITGFANSIYFNGPGVDAWAYKAVAYLANTNYVLSMFVKMDDGSTPVFGSSAVGFDGGLVLFGGLVASTTVSLVGNGLYRISATASFGTAGSGNFGVVKYATNSTRRFTVTGYQLELGTTATTYQRVNTATDYTGYNATIAERSAASGPSFRLGIQGDRLIATVFDGTTTRTVTSTDSYATGVVVKASVNYSSGRLAINVNGLEVASTNGAPLLTMSNLLSISSRYNLLTQTEDLTNAAWNRVAGGTGILPVVTAGFADPEGGNTAFRVVSNRGAGNTSADFSVLRQSIVASSVTSSAWIRSNTGASQTTNFNIGFGQNFTVTTVWQRIPITYGSIVRFDIGNFGTDGTTSNLDVLVWRPQVELGSTATTYQRVNTATDFNNTSAVFTIGNSRALNAPFPGSISLVKTGVTIPTPEQAWWMFDQERRMFQSGAQITLPASTAVSDLVYDDQQDKWVASQPTFESSFTGLIRTASAAPSAGTFNKVSATNGVKLSSRATTLPGVDVTVPPYGLREELVRRAEAAAKATRPITALNRDAIGFTATTTSASSALTAVSVTSGVPYIGMVVSGTGIPAGTRIIGINGTIYYLSANATATGTAVAIGQTSFTLPVGFTAVEVMTAGNSRQEGATKDYVRNFDGFAETVQFAVSPGSGAWCQFIVRKELV